MMGPWYSIHPYGPTRPSSEVMFSLVLSRKNVPDGLGVIGDSWRYTAPKLSRQKHGANVNQFWRELNADVDSVMPGICPVSKLKR
jgi:hypothetical protein